MNRDPAGGPPAGAGAGAARLWPGAVADAVRKLDPRVQARNPVMFVVWVGAVLVTGLAVAEPGVFAVLVAFWLWFTVLFANLAEALAEGRGRAQAASLRAARRDTVARRLPAGCDPAADAPVTPVPAAELRVGDLVEVTAGETVPGDGDVVHGVASVDESAVTGESAPVIREAGGDRSAVIGGTTVLSDRIVVRITTRPGETVVDRMIALVEGAARARTPNEVALGVLLSALTIVLLLAVAAVAPMSAHAGSRVPLVVLTALLVCLIPTTIGALLSAIGIAGMDRLVRRGVLATSGRAVEAAGDVDTLLIDKTGTVTHGNRRATGLHPAGGATLSELAAAARLASLADPTPEGRSIVELCATDHGLPAGADAVEALATTVPFSARTRMSGVDLDGVAVRKGAARAVLEWARGADEQLQVRQLVETVSAAGGTPLVVATAPTGAAADRGGARLLGVVELSDVVKPGIAARFAELRAMGVRTVMVTGDNPRTAAVIAARAGVDDHVAEATPEDKLALIHREQAAGRLVAMTGDGTNDAPALAQADVGVAMNTGTAAAKEAGNMVDLDSDPAKLVDIVEVGKQLLITRGALTTFSVANDLAKYFAILPAMFAGVYPQLGGLDVMGLATPQSAVLSAVIFNALVIVALVPLALRGVRYRPSSAAALLRRNLFVYGVGGVLTPFAGIALIDLVVRLIPGV
ncbi:potassium-transporting ATPase subunit KdpB [Pseudonocardia sp. NPDC049635]|uniref:potassium-transporting ATPase subunit KdpB n=1 Tax=Pseudonocardia sp. NPDC049635 TaxID=3155506 RepID=UPI0033D43DDF